MSALNDLTGLRFGRLIVERKESSDKYGRPIWRAKCDCGNSITTLGNALKNGNTKSCGCYRKELIILNNKKRALPSGESCFNILFKNYTNEARRRHLTFDLSKNQFRILTDSNCFYCGAEPNQRWAMTGRNGAYVYNGIDRQNNREGYTIENSVACCGRCNLMKHNKSIHEFIQACQAVTDYQKELNASRNRGAI